MPKSQKPRKRYRKEEHAQPPVVTQEQIDQIHSMTTDYELVTEESLPRGCATLNHLRCMRDVINLAITDLLLQNKYTIEQSEILNAGGEAIQSVSDNGFAHFGGKRFVCRAAELDAIRNAMELAAGRVHEAFEERPLLTLQRFRTMKEIIKTGHGRTTVSRKRVEKTLRRLGGKRWRN